MGVLSFLKIPKSLRIRGIPKPTITASVAIGSGFVGKIAGDTNLIERIVSAVADMIGVNVSEYVEIISGVISMFGAIVVASVFKKWVRIIATSFFIGMAFSSADKRLALTERVRDAFEMIPAI